MNWRVSNTRCPPCPRPVIHAAQRCGAGYRPDDCPRGLCCVGGSGGVGRLSMSSFPCAATRPRHWSSSLARCGTPGCRSRSRPAVLWPTPQVIGEAAPAARHVTERYATTRSKPTMDGSRPGCGRCADSNVSPQQALSRPGTRSCRTCAAASTPSLSDPGSNPRGVRRPCPVPLTERQADCPAPACSNPDQCNTAFRARVLSDCSMSSLN
jgi:hypothetical protein